MVLKLAAASAIGGKNEILRPQEDGKAEVHALASQKRKERKIRFI